MKHIVTIFVFFLTAFLTFMFASVLTIVAFGDGVWQLRLILEIMIAVVIGWLCARSIFRSYDAATEANAKAMQEYKLKAAEEAATKASPEYKLKQQPWLR